VTLLEKGQYFEQNGAMKRSVGLAFLGLCFSILIGPMAKASNFATYTVAEIQTFPPYVQDSQKINRFEVGLSADDPDKVIFNAFFSNSINPASLATSGNRTPLFRIKIFYSQSISSSTNSQINIDAPITPYQYEVKLDAITQNPCGAKTWMPKGTNFVTFEISRSCYDLPDKFYVALFVDVNINQDNPDYFSIPEATGYALPLDFSKYPKPKKPEPKKNQIISGYASQPSYTLDVTSINFTTSTNSGLPIQIIGKTPDVCNVTSSTTISLVGVGTCVVALTAPGNDLWNASPEVNFSFNVLPKKVIPKVDQNLYFNPPGNLFENSPETRLDIYSDSKLDVQVTSSTPDVCMFPYSAPNNTVVKIYAPGTCAFTVKQAGNDRFNAKDGSTSIQIYSIPKPSPSKAGVKPAPVPSQSKQATKPPTPRILNGTASTSGGGNSGTVAEKGTGVNKGGSTSITCIDNKTKKPTQLPGKTSCPAGSTRK